MSRFWDPNDWWGLTQNTWGSSSWWGLWPLKRWENFVMEESPIKSLLDLVWIVWVTPPTLSFSLFSLFSVPKLLEAIIGSPKFLFSLCLPLLNGCANDGKRLNLCWNAYESWWGLQDTVLLFFFAVQPTSPPKVRDFRLWSK